MGRVTSLLLLLSYGACTVDHRCSSLFIEEFLRTKLRLHFFCFHTIEGLQDVRIEAFQEQYSPGQETLFTIANLGRPLFKTKVWSEARTSWRKWCCTVLTVPCYPKRMSPCSFIIKRCSSFVDPFISSDTYHLPCVKSRLPSRRDMHHRKLL